MRVNDVLKKKGREGRRHPLIAGVCTAVRGGKYSLIPCILAMVMAG